MDIGGAPMIHRVWSACGSIFKKILLTSKDPSDDPLALYAIEQVWPIYRGSLEDVLSRYVWAARAIKPTVLVRVCGDAPFLESRWIWKAVEEVEKTDEPVFVPNALHAGTIDHWLQASDEATDVDREHAAHDWFELCGRTLKLVPEDYFSVNTEEDMEKARKLWVSK